MILWDNLKSEEFKVLYHALREFDALCRELKRPEYRAAESPGYMSDGLMLAVVGELRQASERELRRRDAAGVFEVDFDNSPPLIEAMEAWRALYARKL